MNKKIFLSCFTSSILIGPLCLSISCSCSDVSKKGDEKEIKNLIEDKIKKFNTLSFAQQLKPTKDQIMQKLGFINLEDCKLKNVKINIVGLKDLIKNKEQNITFYIGNSSKASAKINWGDAAKYSKYRFKSDLPNTIRTATSHNMFQEIKYDQQVIILDIGYHIDFDGKIIGDRFPGKTIEVPKKLPVFINSTKKMFQNCVYFNDSNIQKWNVKNVTDMSYMFETCYSFNQNLNNWDVSNVTNMSNLFNDCWEFKNSLNNWDVSNVKNMSSMFRRCLAFNNKISDWDVSKVTNMNFMFYNCMEFNQEIKDWKVNNVEFMESMFEECQNFNQNLNDWKIGKVTDITKMFYKCMKFNKALDKWNVENVIQMEKTFGYCSVFDQNISSWKTKNVIDMQEMFLSCSNFNQNISNWNVQKVIKHKNFSKDANSEWLDNKKPNFPKSQKIYS